MPVDKPMSVNVALSMDVDEKPANEENIQTLNNIYRTMCLTGSNINEHLPTLVQYAKKCETILELNARECASSCALMKGLSENGRRAKIFTLCSEYDIEEGIIPLSDSLNIRTTHCKIDSMKYRIQNLVDIVFINAAIGEINVCDYLEKYGLCTRKYMMIHGTCDIAEFLSKYEGTWNLYERYNNNNGLVILERISGV